MTLCPNHHDRNPSLKITPRNGSDSLFHCFAGCDQMAVLRELADRELIPNRFKHRPSAPRVVARLRALLEQFGSGRAAATDRILMTAHLEIATRLRKSRYDVSVRELAELSGLTIASVSRSNRRLRRGGWLCRVGKRGRGYATTWELKIPLQLRSVRNIPDRQDASRTVCSADFVSHDLWRWSGLGKSKQRVYEALGRRMTAQELAAALNVLPRTAQLHLQALNFHRLVQRGADNRWQRTERSLHEVAREIGVAGAGGRQCRRHDEEREKHGRYLIFRFGVVPPSCRAILA